MKVQEFFDANPKPKDGGFHPFPRIHCADGFHVSVQAHAGAYCSPRDNEGPWSAVECGFPSADVPLLHSYAEDPDKQPIFGINDTTITLGDLRKAVAALKKAGVEL